MSLQAILDDCDIKIQRCVPVHGGDINPAYCLFGAGLKYFLKVNDNRRYPGMFAKEANGLNALTKELATFKKRATLKVPGVIKLGEIEEQQYLLLEWLEPGEPSKKFWEDFGAELARLHRQPQAYFGWEEDNYIGSLWQLNTRHESWHLFYTECRIMPLIKKFI